MLLDAAGDSPLAQPANAAMPLPVPQFQTHVFQPPVTGPPVKRTQTRPTEKAATLGVYPSVLLLLLLADYMLKAIQ